MVAAKAQKAVVVIALALAFVVVVLLAFRGYVFVVVSGLGGWAPDARSAQARHASAVDAQLRSGMTRDQVLGLFKADTFAHPKDGMLESLAGSSDRVWDDESDLYVSEPRRYFWNSYDSTWIVRAGFDRSGYLVHHRVDVEKANGF
jgi:hypothetical protein